MQNITSAFCLAVLLASSGSIAHARQAAEVIVSDARRVTLADPIEALGTLRANESTELTASITETISEIRFRDSERVRAGQVLVALTNREQLAELAEAEAQVAEAQRQFDRIVDLTDRGQESRALLDQRRRELETAQARLGAVEARLSDRLITAPFDGVVGLRDISVGSLMTPGRVITTLVDDSIMKLDFGVPEVLLAKVQTGLAIEATSSAWPDERFRGEVASISNQVDPVTRSFQVRARLPNADGKLRPGMLMVVTLSGREREAVVVPEEAILSRGRSHHVMVVDRSREQTEVHRRPVELGRRLPGQVEISSGLAADETVVIHGGFRLSDGQPVRVRATMKPGQSLAQILADDQGS